MGYFSNGTEGDRFEAQWCARCVHRYQHAAGCPVWVLHEDHNHHQLPEYAKTPEARGAAEARRELLAGLIEDGPEGNRCLLFVEASAEFRREERERWRQAEREAEYREAVR